MRDYLQHEENIKNTQEEIYENFNGLMENQKNLITNFLSMNYIGQNITLKNFLNEFEKRLIESALNSSCGSKKKAAVLLGVKFSTLSEKIKKHKIKQNNRFLK